MFALDLSAGIGGNFSAQFQRVILNSDGKDLIPENQRDGSDANLIGGGGFLFFDANYAMFTVGLNILSFSPVNKKDGGWGEWTDKDKYTFTALNIGLLGRYPIDLGAFSIFPMLGVEAQLMLSDKYTYDGTEYKMNDDGKYGKDDVSFLAYYSNVIFKAGVGADIGLGDSLYLRPMFLYGVGLKTKQQQEEEERAEEYFGKKIGNFFNHGFNISLALGYKF